MDRDWKRKIFPFIRGWVFTILLALFIATSFRSAIADWSDVPTGSMKPTILEGDRVFVNKLAYDLKIPYTTIHLARWDNPKRGDVVILFSPADGTRLVKRVIGLPGDTLAMWRNQLIINGEPVRYDELKQDAIHQLPPEQRLDHLFYTEGLYEREHLVMLTPAQKSPRTFSPLKIPEGKYFVMGDNRDVSADSRFFGFVERKQIVGRVLLVVFSLELDNHYLPRWHRFFEKLS
ncbi:MAG: signal peptidase I [Deltaproteobacteria bacterium]|nr:signal peptidase I [Deltaproteobacteria bacterium]